MAVSQPKAAHFNTRLALLPLECVGLHTYTARRGFRSKVPI